MRKCLLAATATLTSLIVIAPAKANLYVSSWP
jgi:hypothetical protein